RGKPRRSAAEGTNSEAVGVGLTTSYAGVQRGRESRSLLRSPWPCLSAGCIEGDRRTDERLERARVDLLPLMDVNRAPYVPVEARVEELGRVLQGGSLGEGQLHYRLVRLAGADDPVVRPYGSAHPLPLLHDVRVCLFDELAHPAQGLPAPVPELGDPFVDQLRCRLALGRTRLFHVLLLKLPNSSTMPSNNSFKRHNFSMSLEEAPNVPHYRRALLLCASGYMRLLERYPFHLNSHLSMVTMCAWILPSTAPRPNRLPIAATEMSVASPSREASRASISFLSGVPRQYAIAGIRADVARLRAATVSIRGEAINPPFARSRSMIRWS